MAQITKECEVCGEDFECDDAEDYTICDDCYDGLDDDEDDEEEDEE